MDVKSVATQGFFDHQFPKKDPDGKVAVDSINDQIKSRQETLQEKQPQEITVRDLEKGIDSINKFLENNFTSLNFQVHEELDRLFVEVVDSETKEVVREIPPKQFLDMISSMLEYVGLIVDKKV